MEYETHLTEAGDLVTTSEQANAAFVGQLLERAECAIPLVEQAKALRVAALSSASPRELLGRLDIRQPLLVAAGLSALESRRLGEAHKLRALGTLVEDVLLPRGEHFVDELVYRFLLAKGSGLSKILRRLVSLVANRKIARGVTAALLVRGLPMLLKRTDNSTWQSWDAAESDPPLGVRGVAWTSTRGPRTLLFNNRVPIVSRTVDVVVKKLAYQLGDAGRDSNHPELFLALGQIKGNAAPLKANDEWNAARSSLAQIRARFTELRLTPETFLVASDISERAALEIWAELTSGQLSNAANSNDEVQLASVCQWMIKL